MLHEELTEQIIKAFYRVYNTLGFGFLEKVYENALVLDLRKNNFLVEQQKPIIVFYEDEPVGEYFADLLVNKTVIIELKVCENLIEVHKAQMINYLKATKIEVGLLLNFGKKPEIKRVIFNSKRLNIGD
jgi:GxxExxY protein